jgi:hypothetical protein
MIQVKKMISVEDILDEIPSYVEIKEQLPRTFWGGDCLDYGTVPTGSCLLYWESYRNVGYSVLSKISFPQEFIPNCCFNLNQLRSAFRCSGALHAVYSHSLEHYFIAGVNGEYFGNILADDLEKAIQDLYRKLVD